MKRFLFLMIIILIAGCDSTTTATDTCGDSVIDVGEDCDGEKIGDASCTDYGYYSGVISCNEDCTLNISACGEGGQCGDGVINGTEGVEECDGTNLNGKSCTTEGYYSGTLACSSACKLDTSGCNGSCGDGALQASESCDGTNLYNQTCADVGDFYEGAGTLSCGSDCQFDTSQCQWCGDGLRNGSEECDGEQFGTATCETEGFLGGSLTCTSDCTIDTSTCSGSCGNGTLDELEVCDGTLFGETDTCHEVDSAFYDGYGTLTCSNACELVTTQCARCGDGTINGPEECDGLAFGAVNTCHELDSIYHDGYGNLVCTDCVFDDSGCVYCGDGTINGPEQCEGSNLGSYTDCHSVNTMYHSGYGSISCNGSCGLDTSSCIYCGDGTANGPEACDSNDLAGQTCHSLNATYHDGFGTLACDGNCGFDTSGCVRCGDLTVNGPEECDGSNGGLSCNDLDSIYHSGYGSLSCTSGCTYNTSLCISCGDGVKNGPEVCDTTDLGSVPTCGQEGFAEGELGCLSDCSGGDYDACIAWTQVAGGKDHTCAIDANGDAWCWGTNTYGQLGQGNYISSTYPLKVTGLSGVTRIAAGYQFTCAIAAGRLYCWGKGEHGRLGNNSTSNRTSPVQVYGSYTTWSDVSLGFSHACGIRSNNAYCWGQDGGSSVHKLGIGNVSSSWNQLTPAQVCTTLDCSTRLSGVHGIAVGTDSSCATASAGGGGATYCWGSNYYHQINSGSLPTYAYAYNISLTSYQVAVGEYFACATISGGNIQCWGENASGQLGNGNTTNWSGRVNVRTDCDSTCVNFTGAVEIKLGYNSACARKSTGEAFCWGYGGQGALGQGTTTSSYYAIPVPTQENVTAIGTGFGTSFFVNADHRLYATGRNAEQQLGINSTVTNIYSPEHVIIP